MSEIIGVLVAFLPLLLIVAMANLAEYRREREEPYQAFAIWTYLTLGLLYGLGVLVGITLQALGTLLVSQPTILDDMPMDLVSTGLVDSLPVLGLGIWAPSLAGLILLLPPVRRFFARFTDLNAESPVHAVALSLSMLVVINLVVTLAVGLGNLTTLLEEQAAAGVSSNTMLTLWVQQIIMAVLAVMGVGWLAFLPSRRSLQGALDRLGFTGTTMRHVMIGAGLGLAFVPLVMVLEATASLLGLGANPDVEALTEQLLGPLFQSPLGILTLGLAAALGEETLFRGALQPRFGLILTSLLFALLHSNYGITISTLIVFLLGIALGLVRIRLNTTAAMTMHAVYNMTLGLIAYLSLSLLEF